MSDLKKAGVMFVLSWNASNEVLAVFDNDEDARAFANARCCKELPWDLSRAHGRAWWAEDRDPQRPARIIRYVVAEATRYTRAILRDRGPLDPGEALERSGITRKPSRR